jgi:hypothetical protein
MRGDMAVQSNIHYVPKMDAVAEKSGFEDATARHAAGMTPMEGSYAEFMADVLEMQKRGEEVYSIRPMPGRPLTGGTIWVYDSFGEQKAGSPAVIGDLMAGVQIDEDLNIYFVTRRTRLIGGKPFLEGRGGTYGEPANKENRNQSTATYVKVSFDKLRVLSEESPIPLDDKPARAPDLEGGLTERGRPVWLDGVQWMYAGACPVVFTPCGCPSMRAHLDWYKRSYVSEAYRHSFAVLDTNGNLVMRVGRYANFDSAPGGKDGCRPGETDIGITSARFISGTDSYLAFDDWGERLIVLRMEYHEVGTAMIGK